MSSAKKLEIPVEILQEVFFEAGLAGWVSGAKPTKLPEFPGSHQFRFEKQTKYGKVAVLDTYWAQEGSNVSWGFTNIHHNDDIVWHMRYGGAYQKEAIVIVKQAIRRAYESKSQIFFGCRGVWSIASEGIWYRNVLTTNSTFTKFSGKEKVINKNTYTSLGYHDYSGELILLP